MTDTEKEFKESFVKWLVDSQLNLAKKQQQNALMSGLNSEAGSYEIKRKIQHFKDGYMFAKTGKSECYTDQLNEYTLIKEFEQAQQHPSWQTYLKLREQFGAFDEYLDRSKE